MINIIKKERSVIPEKDIIKCILRDDPEGVRRVLEKDPFQINSVHEASGMNAIMLATSRRMKKCVQDMLRHGQVIDFNHKEKRGKSLLEISLRTLNADLASMIADAYIEFAPHIVNNWPEPD